MATVAKKSRGSKFKTFADLEAAGVFDKPLKQRPSYAIGRGGEKRTPRDYGIRGVELEALKAAYAGGDEFPNPHNKGFSYFAIEALKSLGLNRNHSLKRFIERFRELASAEKDKKTGKTFWQTFKNKENRNEATGRNWLGRLTTNLEVLQRVPVAGRKNVHPYGLKILLVGQRVLGTKGAVIDIVYGSSGDVMVRLNTDSDMPVNETKKSRRKVTVEVEGEVNETTEAVTPVETDSGTIVTEPVVVVEPVVETEVQTPVEVTAVEPTVEVVTVESAAETVDAPKTDEVVTVL